MGKYGQLLKKTRDSVEYWTQRAMRKFVGDAIRRMSSNNISRAEMAERLSVSPAYVTKILRGDVNFTLETMVKIARAVGGELTVGIVDSAASVSVGNTVLQIPDGAGVGTASVTVLTENTPGMILLTQVHACNEMNYSVAA